MAQVKKLKDLLSAIIVEEIVGSDDKEITTVVSDSRRVIAGSLFVAVKGVSADGHATTARL